MKELSYFEKREIACIDKINVILKDFGKVNENE